MEIQDGHWSLSGQAHTEIFNLETILEALQRIETHKLGITLIMKLSYARILNVLVVVGSGSGVVATASNPSQWW